MNIKELLPIGSVVMLNGATKRLMIYGVGQTDNSDDKDYDYIGVMYPEGNMGDGSQFLFNHSDISEVYFKGYHDNEREDFLDRLQMFYDESEDV